MKLTKFRVLVLTACFVCLIVSGSLSPVRAQTKTVESHRATETVKQPSFFKQGKDGVLWFQKGTDGETAHSASMILSAVTDGIVLIVTANEKHIEGAIKLARQMQTVLQKSKSTPSHIPIVAFKDTLPGVGYRFYTDGMGCSIGEKSIFTPSEAKTKEVLSRVVKQFQVLGDIAAEGRWGQDDDNETALEIVPP